MALRASDLVEIVVFATCPNTLLDGHRPGIGRRLLAGEVGLEGHHAGDREQQGGVVRNQRRRCHVVGRRAKKSVNALRTSLEVVGRESGISSGGHRGLLSLRTGFSRRRIRAGVDSPDLHDLEELDKRAGPVWSTSSLATSANRSAFSARMAARPSLAAASEVDDRVEPVGGRRLLSATSVRTCSGAYRPTVCLTRRWTCQPVPTPSVYPTPVQNVRFIAVLCFLAERPGRSRPRTSSVRRRSRAMARPASDANERERWS